LSTETTSNSFSPPPAWNEERKGRKKRKKGNIKVTVTKIDKTGGGSCGRHDHSGILKDRIAETAHIYQFSWRSLFFTPVSGRRSLGGEPFQL
jgi:hypothetical protein